MTAPISLQLYTLRDTLANDFAGGIRKVADMGYVGVETAGFPGTTPKQAADLFKQLGLKVSGAHAPLPIGDKKNEALDTMAALDCKQMICAWMPAERFKTPDDIKRVCEELNAADAVARENGLTFFYHNHWWEFQMVNGQPAYKYMLQYLAPTVHLEIDTYWVKTGGQDPVAVIREIGKRAPLLHIKDGPANTEAPMVAVGDGVMDWQAITNASKDTADWFVVELDRCATDMVQAVQKSYTYLTSRGFARGNKS